MSFKELVNGQMDRHMMTTDVTDHSLQVSGDKIINIVTYDCKFNGKRTPPLLNSRRVQSVWAF